VIMACLICRAAGMICSAITTVVKAVVPTAWTAVIGGIFVAGADVAGTSATWEIAVVAYACINAARAGAVTAGTRAVTGTAVTTDSIIIIIAGTSGVDAGHAWACRAGTIARTIGSYAITVVCAVVVEDAGGVVALPIAHATVILVVVYAIYIV
jgi:hypothetical protein